MRPSIAWFSLASSSPISREWALMAGAGLRISVDDRVAIVTIDRPDVLNALNTVLLEELLATLTDLGSDSGIAAIILTGEGDRSFIAGADIKEMAGKTPLEARAYS